jgi:putative transposase
MPRKPIVRSNEHYYHLTARSNNKEDFYIRKELMWSIMLSHLRSLQHEHRIQLAAFVLMDNHFHILMLTPEEDIDRIMYFFMKKISTSIRKSTGRINRVFGNRYKGCLILDESHLFNVYKYIYRNPVKAGLCQNIEQYKYSSWKMTNPKVETLFFSSPWSSGELKWLNEGFKDEVSNVIKFSLRKTIFDMHPNYKPVGA